VTAVDAKSDVADRGWLGPLRPPRVVGLGLFRFADALADRLGPLPQWAAVGGILGGLSFPLTLAIGWSPAALVTAALLVPLVLAAAARDSLARAFAAVGACFAAHSAAMIAFAAADPAAAARLFPAGGDYWIREQRPWILTGENREYRLSNWLPAHLQLLAVMVPFTYTSLGVVTYWQGLYEVDLMNVYVGSLLAESRSAWPVAVAGWHPWSLCRGLGYVVIAFEVTSLSLARLAGVTLSPARRRLGRWAVGLGLLGLDAALKLTLLEPVRQLLAANLR
jgi:hypothetical protein